MSIQIIVATPLAFYSRYLQSEHPEKDVLELYAALERQAALALPINREDAEFFEADLSAPIHSDLYDLVFEKDSSLLESYDADVFLPIQFSGKRQVSIGKIVKHGTLKIVSTVSLSAAIDRIRLSLPAWTTGDKAAVFSKELDIYHKALGISKLESQPIFFSY